ncbi:hypothetical protein Acsp05_37520 [Actinokineospora sp. NBRC 105648]|nr:hypothetical protein Acsp05_37520 [Actinokineospora sp. NBRC 105648]
MSIPPHGLKELGKAMPEEFSLGADDVEVTRTPPASADFVIADNDPSDPVLVIADNDPSDPVL